MENLKKIFSKAVSLNDSSSLWEVRYELCKLYNPEDAKLCHALDRAVEWVDVRIAEVMNG